MRVYLVYCISALLAAGLGQDDPSYSEQDARAGAQLRSHAAIVIPIVYGPCPRSDVIEPVVARYEQFKSGLTGDSRHIDLAIAESDYQYQMSLVDIACPELSYDEALEYDTLRAVVANQALDWMESTLVRQSERAN